MLKEAKTTAVLHEIDGIQEEDNELPNWWLATLYGAILFSVIYWISYHLLAAIPTPSDEYRAEVDRKVAIEAEEIKKSGKLDNAALTTLSKDRATVDKGREIFMANCVTCHLASGGGGIGPNLTDNSYIRGSAPEAIFGTISGGSPGKGMPAWKDVLGLERVAAVAAYAITLRNTNTPNGKAPQGETAPAP
jgi:cytochrome c oxidase cbb3-type subunit III